MLHCRETIRLRAIVCAIVAVLLAALVAAPAFADEASNKAANGSAGSSLAAHESAGQSAASSASQSAASSAGQSTTDPSATSVPAHQSGLLAAGTMAPAAPAAPAAQGTTLTAQASDKWTRLYGETALDTMREISKAGFGASDVAVVATMEGYWDALAASSLAGAYGAPILLTDDESLSQQTSEELDRLGAKTVFIVGGPDAVSDDVQSQLTAKGLTTQRLAGETAVETAIAVANHVKQIGKAGDRCIVATIDTYHDALAIAPYAYAFGAPVFLTDWGGASLSPDVLEAIAAGGYAHATIVGGPLAVSNGVQGLLASAGVADVNRLGGEQAYETACVIAKWERDQGMTADNMGVACGTGYWDALAGAALCGKNRSVILLADNSNFRNATMLIEQWRPQIAAGYVFGGPVVVQDRAYECVQTGVTDSVYDGLSHLKLGNFTKLGIDVSQWNGNIDWNRVRDAGVDFAIIRCGYGSDYASQDDWTFMQNVSGARAAGIEIGVYLYSYAHSTDQALSEAAHTVRLLKAAGLGPSDVPYGVYYDLEEADVGNVANRGLLANMAATYCTAIQAAGYRPGVYSGLWWWDIYLTDPVFNSWSRWVAQWNTSCTYLGAYDMWQCTNEGVVDGIEGTVDMDVYYR